MPIEGTLSDQGPSKERQEGEKANKWIPSSINTKQYINRFVLLR